MKLIGLMKLMKIILLTALLLMVSHGLALAEQIVTPRTLVNWQREGREHVLIDVRYASLFETGHIANAINIPAAALPHENLPAEMDIVLYDNDLSGMTARKAAAALEEADDVDASHIFVLRGGMRAWEAAGQPTTKPAGVYDAQREQLITGADLLEALRIGMPVQVIDLRDQKSFRTKSIPGAVNVPILKRPEELANLTTDNLRFAVNFSKESRARIEDPAKNVNNETVKELLARDLANAIQTKQSERRAAGLNAAGPVVLIDNGSNIAMNLAPRLARFGYGDALVVERGIVGWKAARGELNQDTQEVIYHGGTLVTREELLQKYPEFATGQENSVPANPETNR